MANLAYPGNPPPAMLIFKYKYLLTYTFSIRHQIRSQLRRTPNEYHRAVVTGDGGGFIPPEFGGSEKMKERRIENHLLLPLRP